MNARGLWTLGMTLVASLSLVACGGDEEPETAATETQIETPPAAEVAGSTLRIADVSLGKSVGPDRRVTTETDEFVRTDTVYASVATEGSASGATLTARWTFQDGQVVDETSRPLSTTGAATTEFHISSPMGLPVGNYAVEILVDGQSAERETFAVQ